MLTLASGLRSELKRVVIDARDAAETGARAALEALGVHHKAPYPHMGSNLCQLRTQLRAKARQLGDRRLPKVAADGTDHQIDHLVAECAYEQWHRMLFARFLAENDLLIEPQEKTAISLTEAEELAKDEGVDMWVFASRCAQGMLPQIFRPDDPLLQVGFATEHRLELENLLASLSEAVFTASDALGWVYQFWQSKKKDEVNRSGVKIRADEIAAVTQLFTEPYMVEFLLHNTLGAWWAGKNLSADDAAAATTEGELRQKVALPGVEWEYLRFVRGNDATGGPWRPAAGMFDGWPKTAAELKVLDPCCGSGHFLVAALNHLVPIRMAEEGLAAAEAVDCVLSDNLHGLEIDERCCQIAAFAVAFAAWTYSDAGGYRPLPDLHIACTGVAPQATEEQWLELAAQSSIPMPTSQRDAIEHSLLKLHRLFSLAPTLGSLISPAGLPADLLTADYQTTKRYLTAIMSAEKTDDLTRERAIAASGMTQAADLLATKYTLITTNVPYLARGKQGEVLQRFCDAQFGDAKTDLATVFLVRMADLLLPHGASAIVITQNWRFQLTYKALRESLLSSDRFDLVGALGSRAFETISGEVVNVGLFVFSLTRPVDLHVVSFLDTSAEPSPGEKACVLREHQVGTVSQRSQRENPDHVLSLHSAGGKALLGDHAFSYQGIKTGDDGKYKRNFWEIARLGSGWRLIQSTVGQSCEYGGLEHVLRWKDNGAGLARLQGLSAWGQRGIAVSQMSSLPCAFFHGAAFDSNMTAIIPKDEADIAAIYAYASSEEFHREIRRIDRSLKPTNSSFTRVPFDSERWTSVAKGLKYSENPWSDDSRQYPFHGRPEESTAPLQVAVARLLGYRWPAELDDELRLSRRARALVERCGELDRFADTDGIVCISSVRGEVPAVERLLALLVATGIESGKARELAGGADLGDWFRGGFFAEHCKLFHDCPFVWHIWDGRKRDGFHALVNYHKLAEGDGHKGRKLLENLTYSYLGDWISRQRNEVKRGEGGAEDRLAAALELQGRLKAILEGEPPFDLFVRWKPLAEQPIGWEPDINDGVRINIRPFLASDLPNGRKGAGVLRHKPNIKWAKDRGKEPERPNAEYPWFWGWDEATEDFTGGTKFDGNRWNDCHYTNRAKQAAREVAKKGGKA